MAITQNRLHRLLQSAEQYRTLYLHAVGLVADLRTQVHQGRMTPLQALQDLSISLLALPDQGAAIVIAEERIRYNLTHSKNEWVRQHKTSQRRSQGIQPRRLLGELEAPMPLDPTRARPTIDPLATPSQAALALATKLDQEDDALQGIDEDFGQPNPAPSKASDPFYRMSENDRRAIDKFIEAETLQKKLLEESEALIAAAEGQAPQPVATPVTASARSIRPGDPEYAKYFPDEAEAPEVAKTAEDLGL